MADALQEAKHALADAKLRIRVAEASQREKIRERLEKEMRARLSKASEEGSERPETCGDEDSKRQEHSTRGLCAFGAGEPLAAGLRRASGPW